MYKQGKAGERQYMSSKIVFCQICSDKCPYESAVDLKSQGETIGTICSAKGLINKTEISPRFNINIKKQEPKFDLTNSIPLPAELV